MGRYILTPRIFDLLAKQERGAGGEIQLTDGIARLLQHERVSAFPLTGRRYDCGSKVGYLAANLAYGMKHPETQDLFRKIVLDTAQHLKTSNE